ncbi:MAG: hypothetical protein M0P69_19230 [Bacteroidales bacterium]|nr:hypothetical protein [Bacteroidales bacterium]
MTDLARFKDRASTTLSSSCEAGSTSIMVTLASAITGNISKPSYITIWDNSAYISPQDDPHNETAKVISWGGNNLTLSSGLSYSHSSGEKVSILISASPMNDMATLIESNEEAISTKEDAFTKNTAFNKNFGTEAGTVCEGNDSRLSNDRNPTGHNTSHVTGSDIIPDAVAGGNSGLMSGADKARLDGIVPSQVITLTDGATPALDAALGNHFRLTAAGNRTIAVPTNPTEGQKIIIEHIASGADRTLALNTGTGGFAYGSDITGLSATVSGKHDFIGAVYNSAVNKWHVIAYVKGY